MCRLVVSNVLRRPLGARLHRSSFWHNGNKSIRLGQSALFQNERRTSRTIDGFIRCRFSFLDNLSLYRTTFSRPVRIELTVSVHVHSRLSAVGHILIDTVVCFSAVPVVPSVRPRSTLRQAGLCRHVATP